MKNKFKKITTILCLLIIGVTCITGCSATGDITLPTDYNLTTTLTEKNQFRLTVINDSENGTIFPNLNNETSSVMVDEGDSYTFTIKAKEGYEIQNLLIDGELVEAQEIYTFSNINKNHSIGAIYSEKPRAIKSFTLIGLEYDAETAYETENKEYSFGIYHDKRISDNVQDIKMENDLPLLYQSITKVAKKTKESSGYISISKGSFVEIELNNNDSFKLYFKDSYYGGAILTLSIKTFICVENNYYTVYKVNYNKQSINLQSSQVLISDINLYFIANY